MNQEIQELAQHISSLSEAAKKNAEEKETGTGLWMDAAVQNEDIEELAQLTRQLNEKMALLASRLPVLQDSLHIEEDLSRLEQILEAESPLSESDLSKLQRIAGLCQEIQASL